MWDKCVVIREMHLSLGFPRANLRGKYQERYTVLPVRKVQGSAETPLQLRATLILMRYIHKWHCVHSITTQKSLRVLSPHLKGYIKVESL